MWTTILSLATSLIDTKYFKLILVALACVLSASATYLFQSYRYEAQINSINAQMSALSAQQEKEYAEKLSKATSELVLANRRADSARSERDDLSKRLLDANNRETARAEASPDRSYRTEYAQCRKFLSESIDLLNEGANLAGRIAGEKDALSELVK